MEVLAPFKINLEIDADETYDYENMKSIKYCMNDFKDILINEIEIIQNMKK
jgi:hypothetical protein